MPRIYATIGPPDPHAEWDSRLVEFCDRIWSAFSAQGVSWVGFYVPGEPHELLLACCRNKPACSPIGLHGACGRAFLSRRALIVRDVASLGSGYIACDPRDRSELVIPLLAADGSCHGVLDVDSFEPAAFDEIDAREMARLLVATGLSVTPGLPPEVV
jgi:putative methionine-R-sulfoxide reductase with GAF domain